MYDILIAWIDADSFSNLTFDLENWVRVTTVHVGIQDFCISCKEPTSIGVDIHIQIPYLLSVLGSNGK